uniref:Uncharacterized protein n=1 Tax=Streptomyces sp. TP-A0584 TaxID=314563 RepID=A0A6S4QEH4_9ACTN|nr:hypothetical protein [Streptomyces sp. TP-A0584]
MTTAQHEDWTRLEIRRPEDVPPATPLSWQVEKVSRHEDRLFRNRLPAHSPRQVERGDAGDALAVLALRESIRREMEWGRGNRIHEALELGATWRQVAGALDVAPHAARQLLREYADGQRELWLTCDEREERPFGFTAEQHTDVLALCELGDDETAPAVTR